jgi:hypothetical protein
MANNIILSSNGAYPCPDTYLYRQAIAEFSFSASDPFYQAFSDRLTVGKLYHSIYYIETQAEQLWVTVIFRADDGEILKHTFFPV